MGGPGDNVDDRVRAAWRSWLSALATDAEAAMAAALAYESLPDEGRDAWLDALTDDAPGLSVPSLALYAPLLAVEVDPPRRERIERSMMAGIEPESAIDRQTRALLGVSPDGTHACVIVAPLYLDFVQVLSCRYTPGGGFVAVRHEPMRHSAETHTLKDVDGVVVEPTPLRVVVEELAHAILADKREQRVTPAALTSFAHLFVPDLESGSEPAPVA